ncbi:hypothetical protein MMC31_002397, partial [Peltigera leucophlebia]|nr:hypothetical protein [Peltigera leucophlebia]
MDQNLNPQFLIEDSKYEIAKGPSKDLPLLPSTVLDLPPMLHSIRNQVFLLNTDITWTAKEFEDYWPYLDSVWVHNQTRPMTQKNVQRSYWYCRLWRNEKERKSEGAGVRAKRMRTTPSCEMKMVMAKEFDAEIKLQKVTISLHTDKKSPCSSHNHTFDYSDSIKLNSAVRSAAGQEVAKGYTPAAVNRNLQGVKWAGNRDALKDAGGTYLDLKAVHNAGGDFRKANPDIRMKGAKEEWEIQLNDCYDNLQNQGEEILSAKIKATRAFDNEESYGVVYAKR